MLSHIFVSQVIVIEPVGVATFVSSSENLAAFTVVNFDVFGVEGQWEVVCTVCQFNASSYFSDAFIEVRLLTTSRS
jgi:hypothetical protein